VRFVSDVERQTRLARRHGFAERVEGLHLLAERLAGIHSTDPVTVFLSAAARRSAGSVQEIEEALYESRTCLRMLGMRRTLFVEAVALVPTVQRAYTDAFVARERNRFAGWLERCDVVADGRAHIDRMIDLTLARLTEAGEASTRELTTAIPELDQRFVPPVGSQTGSMSVGSRIVLLMTAAGLIARTRPLGTWISSQYRYAPMDHWLGEPIPEVDPAAARAHLARAWLRGFGPGTVTDVRWWTGWTLGQTRSALAAVDAVEVEMENGAGFLLADDVEPVKPVAPWAALLPSLDATPMGWKERAWYLGEHVPRLFDRNGNVGPTVWWNGRVVGGWAQRNDGEVVVEYLEEVPDECRRLVDAESERLMAFLGPTRFTPRFRTPLERSLTA
jgi:hypothetical protein